MVHKCLASLLLALLLGPAARADEQAPVYTLSHATVEDQVQLDLTTRYTGCAMILRVDRVAPDTTRTNLWAGDDQSAIETLDSQVDCACEPLGSAHGTGMKSCPDEECTKDEQCVCSEHCAPLYDGCPPTGELLYEFFDRNDELAATHSVSLPTALPGCVTAPVDEGPAEEPAESSGCTAGPRPTPATALLLLLVIAAVLRLRRRRAQPLLVLAALLFAFPACSKEAADPEQKNAPRPEEKSKEELEPLEGIIEGTPWEAVVALQTDMLEAFETGTSPDHTLNALKHWRLDHLEEFQLACKAAVKYHSQDPDHRLNQMVKAGRAWSVAKTRIHTLTKDWGPAEQRDVGILLHDFACR